jgi:hypothetical protein
MKSALYVALIAAISLAAPAARAGQAPAAAQDVYAAAAQYEFGQSRKPLATIEEEIRKAATPEYRAIEARLLAALKAPGTKADAKRYFCRYLGTVGSAASVPALAALLGDEKLSHPARMALEPMAYPAAGAALRQALGQVKGKLLAGVIGSVGIRRDALAIPALTALTGDADGDVARSAVFALGAIGTSEAAKALDDVAAKAPAALARPVAQARITCAGLLAQDGKTAEAVVIYRALLESKVAPASRIAALRGLIASQDRPAAARLITDMLQGDDAAMRTATLAALASSTDVALKTAVVQELPTLQPAAQKALLGLLPDEKDVAARPALLKLLQASQDEATRLAVLDCLAVHGTGEDVAMLVKMATKDAGPEAAAARKALERMPGTGTNEAIARLLESPESGARGLAMALVNARRIEAAMPVLVKQAAGPDAAVAAEAVKALASLGTTAELPGLVKILTTTSDANLRSAVEGAATSICTRATDREACAKAVIPALDTAATPAARILVLQLLPRVKGLEALAALQRVLREGKEAGVTQAAVRALADWPDIAAGPALLDFAKVAGNATDGVLAMRGCLRLAGMKDAPMAQRLALYRSVLETAQRADEKKQALAGAADLPTGDALDLLLKYTQDPALGADAAMAVIRLAKQIGIIQRDRAAAALEKLKALPDEAIRRQADAAIKSLSSAAMTPDGYILAWMLSGPYTQEGKGGAELFDVAFPPEKAGGGGEWRPVVVPREARGLVEMDKILGGQERVAYLRTEVSSAKAQDAILELGSDDGIKVWVNGQQVHANNATRPCTPGSDKAKIKLKAGANAILMKITQGGGEWSAVARLCAPDGKPLDLAGK